MLVHWYIDPGQGDDKLAGNWGQSPTEALQSHEFFRNEVIPARYPPYGLITDDVVIHLLGNFDETSPVIIDFTLGPNVQLTYRGETQLSATDERSFDDVHAIEPAANRAQEVRDTSLAGGWAASGLVNEAGDLPNAALKRIRVTGGPRAETIAYPCLDLGEGWVRTSPFGDMVKPGPATIRRVAPQKGDPYVVESGFVRIDSFAVDIKVSPVVTVDPKIHLLLSNLELNPGFGYNHQVRARAKPNPDGPATIVFSGCGVGRLTPQYADKVVFEFCRMDRTTFQGTLVQLAGCCCLGQIVVFEGARAVVYADTIFQGQSLRVQGLARLGQVAFFDADPAGLQVEQSGTAQVETLLATWQGGQAVYGQGHAVTGASIRAGGCIIYEPLESKKRTARSAGISATGSYGGVNVAGTLSQWDKIAPDLAPRGKRAAVACNDLSVLKK